MRDLEDAIVPVVISVLASALAHGVGRWRPEVGLAPVIVTGLVALWAIAVTTITTFPLWGEYPSRAEVWTARALVALACASWALAAMLWPGATTAGRLAASVGAVAAFATSSWLVGG